MRTGYAGCGRDAIASECLLSAVDKPVELSALIFSGFQSEFLVIARQTHHPVWSAFLEPDKEFNDGAAVRASVEVVAKKDKSVGTIFSIRLTINDQAS